MKKATIILFALALIGWWFSEPSKVDLPAGAFAPDEPYQKNIKDAPDFDLKGYRITPLASFDLNAKILSKKRYRLDREADLAPYDLALGWGVMSDQSVVETLKIRQANRWYMYSGEHAKVPYSFDVIARSSANMHIVPANGTIEKQLAELRAGSIINLSGKLISASHSDGFKWSSSLTRNDKGGGACELFYLESVRVVRE